MLRVGCFNALLLRLAHVLLLLLHIVLLLLILILELLLLLVPKRRQGRPRLALSLRSLWDVASLRLTGQPVLLKLATSPWIENVHASALVVRVGVAVLAAVLQQIV